MKIEISKRVHASVAGVWATLTDVGRWWPGTILEPRPGGKFEERWTDDAGRPVVTSGRVVNWDPPHGLTLSWKDESWHAVTTVTIRLRAMDMHGTEIALVHDGWEALPDNERLAATHEHGWSHHLEQLAAAVDEVTRASC